MIDLRDYSALYKKEYKKSNLLVRFSCALEETIGCAYTTDKVNAKFIKKLNNELKMTLNR